MNTMQTFALRRLKEAKEVYAKARGLHEWHEYSDADWAIIAQIAQNIDLQNLADVVGTIGD